jgi:hypothetical protein
MELLETTTGLSSDYIPFQTGRNYISSLHYMRNSIPKWFFFTCFPFFPSIKTVYIYIYIYIYTKNIKNTEAEQSTAVDEPTTTATYGSERLISVVGQPPEKCYIVTKDRCWTKSSC